MKAKRVILMAAVLSLASLCMAQSIADAVRAFDTAVFNSSGSRADTAIGFVTYEDTGACGSVGPWIQAELKRAAASTRRISVVDSSSVGLTAKTVVATRGVSGNLSSAKKNGARSIGLSGTYYENGENLELFLSLHTDDGRLFASETALIPLSEIKRRRLSLYPENNVLAKQVQEDFAASQEQDSSSPASSNKTPDISAPSIQKKSNCVITAAMLDAQDNLVNILHPNDTVRFLICTSLDSYIALLSIDANGDKNWLPLNNNFLQADEVYTFPDIPNQVYKVVDGVYGAEQILVYASTSPAGLPEQNSGGTYRRGDIQQTTRGIMAVKEQSEGSYETSVFKITYTVLE